MSSKAATKKSDSASPAQKAPSKPKVAAKVVASKPAAKAAAAKTSGKKVANPKNAAKNAEAAAKKKAEQQRYSEALAVAAERGLVTVFEELTPATVQDKWTTAVGLHILETISHIQQTEVRKDGDYNPYPAKNFLLFEDKVSSSGKKKAPVKNGKSESTTSAPKKKKAPLKRGAKPAVEEPEEDVEVEVQLDDTADHNEEEAPADGQSETKEEKEEKKKNITTFTRDAKNYLGFVVMRFVDDYFSSQGGKAVKNRDDFTTFTYTGITKDINSHVSRSVVTTVNRMQELVSNLQDRGVPDELSKLVGAHLQDRGSLIKFMGEYVSDYLKLVGYVLAQQLWVSRKAINQQAIEGVVRLLDMGNHDALIEAKAANENESDYGLSCGFYQDAHVYSSLVIPKAPKKPRTAPAKGKGKGKGKGKAKAADADAEADADGDDAEADGDDAEAEEADDAEADGDDAEADGDDAEADGDEEADDAEAEEAEEEPEPEPEPEPAPKKPLKKLKA